LTEVGDTKNEETEEQQRKTKRESRRSSHILCPTAIMERVGPDVTLRLSNGDYVSEAEAGP
jgi:hypothetical protein